MSVFLIFMGFKKKNSQIFEYRHSEGPSDNGQSPVKISLVWF